MEPLFDKPLSELREAFVRARFAEDNIFGRPDIEEWLEDLRRKEDPDVGLTGVGRYEKLIVQHADHQLGEHYLPRYATPVTDEEEVMRCANLAQPHFCHLVLAAVRGGGELYRNARDRPVVFISNNAFVAVPYEGIRAFSDQEFLGVVFAEWKLGGSKAAGARDFICNALSRAIATARQGAERDFDEACAVSADGTKIVHAKYVFVAKGRVPTHGTLFDAHTFAMHKIRCPKILPHESIDRSTLEQIDMDPRKLTLDLYLGYMLRHWSFYQMGGDWMGGGGALLVNDRKCGNILPPNKTILFVNEQYCPSPLPEGGREIRV